MLSLIVLASSITLVFGSYGHGGGHYDHAVDAAVKSYQSINTYPVASMREVKNPVVDINSGPLPLTLRFNTHSSHINAIQKHFGQPGTVQKSSAVDEPDLLIQTIKKPVINEIREVISPYRHRTQEVSTYLWTWRNFEPYLQCCCCCCCCLAHHQVRPVQEKIETILPKNHEGYGHKEGGHYEGHGEHY